MDDYSIPCLIYKISNKINSKLYIGVTTNGINHRWARHKRDARDPKYAHLPLYAAMREFGVDQFWIEQIEECTDTVSMYKRELEIIKDWETIHPNGYNFMGKQMGDAEAAIVRFNICEWTAKQYAETFGVSVATIRHIRSKYSAFQHITREHIPDNVDAILERAMRLRDIRRQA